LQIDHRSSAIGHRLIRVIGDRSSIVAAQRASRKERCAAMANGRMTGIADGPMIDNTHRRWPMIDNTNRRWPMIDRR